MNPPQIAVKFGGNPPDLLQPKILVIRGGAIGDFLLTMPAVALLREAFPQARLEILGYDHIVSLASSGGYADGVRSIEYAAMAAFFNPKAALDEELAAYFGGFQQVVSYLYDPDGFFSGNLRRCGVKNLIEASPKIDPEGEHASRQLARPLENLALYLDDAGGVLLRPGPNEKAFADDFLTRAGIDAGDRPLVAIHPGSGGERKNWPTDRWRDLGLRLLARPSETRPRLLLVGGEADTKALAILSGAWRGAAQAAGDVLVAENLPLPALGAILAHCRWFLGHDSGISHLAAAVGTPCVLLFGPTDPDIWAPPYPAVEIIRSPDAAMSSLNAEIVRSAVEAALAKGGKTR